MRYTKKGLNSDIPLMEQVRLANKFSGGEFIMVPYNILKLLGTRKAIILNLYIHKFIQTSYSTPENNGWFYFLTKEIQTICPDVTERYISKFRKELKTMGILKSKRVGLNPIVWNWIDFNRLDKYIMDETKDIKKNVIVGHVTDNFDGQVCCHFDGQNNYTDNNYILSAKALSDTCVSASVLNDPEIEIISYWNTLPNVTKHKLDPNSKTIQSACKMLSALLQGFPIITIKDNQPRKELRSFFQVYKIDQVYLRKKWEVKEINGLLRTAINNRSKSKETGKVSLPNILWNEFASRDKDGVKTAFSWFYYSLALDNTPTAFIEMARELAENLKTKNPPILKWANSLYSFSISEEITASSVSNILTWYLKNKQKDYMPVVRDMEEFIKKYTKITVSRVRVRQHSGKNKLHIDEPVQFYDALGNIIE